MKTTRLVMILSFFFSLSLLSFRVANAEITKPYIVDEKPQVIFGDSAQVDNHFGLENYTQDYVNGYAHITFTYTHHVCCFPSAPPLIYITDVDPRTTANSVNKFIGVITADIFFNTPTDWYLYDIQFDSTGYTTIRRQEATTTTMTSIHTDVLGFSGTDWVAIANRFVNPTPPNVITMAFTPVPIAQPTCCSNVLFIPGLEASRLYEDLGPTCTLNCINKVWEPSLPSDVTKLYLDSNGQSIKNIFTNDVVDKTIKYKIYGSLISNFDSLVSLGRITRWTPYAYDWRQSIDDIVNNGTYYHSSRVSLIDTLRALVASSTNGKVTIVTHSNGGLIAKALIKKLEDMKSSNQSDLIDHIDNLIMTAPPQIGTADALSSILNGFNQSIKVLGFYNLVTASQARDLAVNMLSAYSLLPSKLYFDQSGIIDPASFSSVSPQMYLNAYGLDVNTYQEEHSFVLGQEGRTAPVDSDVGTPLLGNSLLLAQAETLHDSIDNMSFPTSIKVYDIAGWGKETVGGMVYGNDKLNPVFTFNGDGTVVEQSALFGSGTKYWLDLSRSKIDHKQIMEDPQILAFIDSVIENTGAPTTLSTNRPLQVGNRLHLSVHSPVSIGVYDNQGNFTGKICDNSGDCSIQQDIPGSTYLEFGEGKYVNLDQGDLQRAVLQGTDVGTFTFDYQTVTPNDQITTYSFVDIPVTTQTQATITTNSSNQIPQLALDVTGDGVTDFTLTPNSAFDPVTYLQIMKSTIDSLDLAQAKKNAFDNMVDNIIKSIQKGKIDKAKLRADKFVAVLQNKLSKPDPKHPKPKKLSKTDAQLLLDLLNGLLDNLV